MGETPPNEHQKGNFRDTSSRKIGKSMVYRITELLEGAAKTTPPADLVMGICALINVRPFNNDAGLIIDWFKTHADRNEEDIGHALGIAQIKVNQLEALRKRLSIEAERWAGWKVLDIRKRFDWLKLPAKHPIYTPQRTVSAHNQNAHHSINLDVSEFWKDATTELNILNLVQEISAYANSAGQSSAGTTIEVEVSPFSDTLPIALAMMGIKEQLRRQADVDVQFVPSAFFTSGSSALAPLRIGAGTRETVEALGGTQAFRPIDDSHIRTYALIRTDLVPFQKKGREMSLPKLSLIGRYANRSERISIIRDDRNAGAVVSASVELSGVRNENLSVLDHIASSVIPYERDALLALIAPASPARVVVVPTIETVIWAYENGLATSKSPHFAEAENSTGGMYIVEAGSVFEAETENVALGAFVRETHVKQERGPSARDQSQRVEAIADGLANLISDIRVALKEVSDDGDANRIEFWANALLSPLVHTNAYPEASIGFISPRAVVRRASMRGDVQFHR